MLVFVVARKPGNFNHEGRKGITRRTQRKYKTVLIQISDIECRMSNIECRTEVHPDERKAHEFIMKARQYRYEYETTLREDLGRS